MASQWLCPTAKADRQADGQRGRLTPVGGKVVLADWKERGQPSKELYAIRNCV
jgi:hypothetical protein